MAPFGAEAGVDVVASDALSGDPHASDATGATINKTRTRPNLMPVDARPVQNDRGAATRRVGGRPKMNGYRCLSAALDNRTRASPRREVGSDGVSVNFGPRPVLRGTRNESMGSRRQKIQARRLRTLEFGIARRVVGYWRL